MVGVGCVSWWGGFDCVSCRWFCRFTGCGLKLV